MISGNVPVLFFPGDSGVVGPQGPKGDQGLKGEQGTPGAAGQMSFIMIISVKMFLSLWIGSMFSYKNLQNETFTVARNCRIRNDDRIFRNLMTLEWNMWQTSLSGKITIN